MDARLLTIFRGDYDGRWRDWAEALITGGVTILEVTLNSPGVLNAITRLRADLGERALVGAGTALSPEDARMAIGAGAAFVVAPDTDEDVIEVCRARDVLFIPGAYTPTEIKRAHKLGAPIVKLFPVPPIDYLRAVRGPLPHIPLMITGGVTADNAAALFQAGASAIGVGGYLTDPKLDLTEVTARARKLTEIVRAASRLPVLA
jgi:2-dehydro-3-deoxyphosphogluconate aldolase/(4S)-4-hydroxy-2-oxoglutarate aldolase